MAPDRCKQSSWLENLVDDVQEISSAKNLRRFTAAFPRRVSESADHSEADRTLDRGGAAQE